MPRTAFYLDASAAVKLVREEPESATLRGHLEEAAHFLSSELLETEVRRAIQRNAVDLSRSGVDRLLEEAAEVLSRFSLVTVTRRLLTVAGALPNPYLRSLDAIHLATALSAPGGLVFVSYDIRQLQAGDDLGLRVLSPDARGVARPPPP